MPNNAIQKRSLKIGRGVGVGWGMGKPLFDYKLDSH